MYPYSNYPSTGAKFTRRIFVGMLIVCVLAFAACHKDHPVLVPQPSPARQVVPVNLIYGPDTNQTVTAFIVVYVNGVKLNIAFDTGSTGFRIVRGALSGTAITLYHENISYGYGNDTKTDYLGIKGVAARGAVAFMPGGAATPLKLMLIESAVYGTGSWFSTTATSTLNGGFRGMNGLMGVGFRQEYNDSISSPLAQLPGGGRFIVSLPRYGGGQGSLIINPAPPDFRGFQPIQLDSAVYHLPNGYKSWNDAALPGTAVIGGITFTQPTLLDTGNPLIWVYNTSHFTRQSYVAPGSMVRIAVSATTGGPALADTTFTVQKQYSGKDWVETNDIENQNSFGIQFFFSYDVLYDPQQGIIAVRKKQASLNP